MVLSQLEQHRVLGHYGKLGVSVEQVTLKSLKPASQTVKLRAESDSQSAHVVPQPVVIMSPSDLSQVLLPHAFQSI